MNISTIDRLNNVARKTEFYSHEARVIIDAIQIKNLNINSAARQALLEGHPNVTTMIDIELAKINTNVETLWNNTELENLVILDHIENTAHTALTLLIENMMNTTDTMNTMTTV